MTITPPDFKKLIWAIREGDTAMVRGLIEADHELGRVSDPDYGRTALMFAAENGHANCVEALIPLSDCKAVSRTEWSALMHAAYYGQVDCVEALLPHSNCGAIDKFGRTALMLAALSDHCTCVEALLPFANLRAVNQHGLSASDIARARGQQEVAELIDSYALAQEERASLASLTEGRVASRAKALSL